MRCGALRKDGEPVEPVEPKVSTAILDRGLLHVNMIHWKNVVKTMIIYDKLIEWHSAKNVETYFLTSPLKFALTSKWAHIR